MDMPKPGSDEARSEGCTCPQDENRMGEGATIASAISGQHYFVIAESCPVHGFTPSS